MENQNSTRQPLLPGFQEPAGRILNGGPGDDLYVLGDGDGDGEVEECLIFDLGSGGIQTTGDQIVLTGFSAESQVVDLGEGVVEIFDTDGDVAILEVQYPDGSPVDGQTIIDSLIFPNESGVTLAGGGQRPLLVIAEDVEGTSQLPRLIDRADRARSDTFIFDESIVQPFDAGAGDDVILVDLSDAEGGQTYQFDGGRGNDLIQIDNSAGLAGLIEIIGIDGADTIVLRNDGVADADIEECLIFDLGSGGVEARAVAPQVLLPDFTDATTEVVELSPGVYQFIDTSTGSVAEIAHEYDNGDPLSLGDIIRIYGEGYMYIDTFEFA